MNVHYYVGSEQNLNTKIRLLALQFICSPTLFVYFFKNRLTTANLGRNMLVNVINKGALVCWRQTFQLYLLEEQRKGSDDGAKHSELLYPFIKSIVRYYKEHNVPETGSISILR
jgi:hypothetical protein